MLTVAIGWSLLAAVRVRTWNLGHGALHAYPLLAPSCKKAYKYAQVFGRGGLFDQTGYLPKNLGGQSLREVRWIIIGNFHKVDYVCCRSLLEEFEGMLDCDQAGGSSVYVGCLTDGLQSYFVRRP